MPTTHPVDPKSEIGEPPLDQLVEPDPHKAGRAYARLVGHGTPVWAIIAYLRGTHGDVSRTAADYILPEEAVRAAMRYYDQNREYIDAHILLNDELWES